MKLIKLQCAYRLRVYQDELEFILLVPLIAVKFSVVIHLTALLVLVIAWETVKFGINTTSVVLEMGIQQEWYLSQVSLLYPCYSQLIPYSLHIATHAVH